MAFLQWAVVVILSKNLDFNKDGFRDLPTGNQFCLISRWKYDNGKGFLTRVGVKVLNDKRTGGELTINPDTDKNTTNSYGLGINTERYEAFAKIGYVFPEKKYKSFGLQLSGIDYMQNSYFGLTTYAAKQQNLYTNLIYQSIINNTAHKFRMLGLIFQFDHGHEPHLKYAIGDRMFQIVFRKGCHIKFELIL